jgi:polysaccharide export outer membrane protein
MKPQHSGAHRAGMLVLLGVFALFCMLFWSNASAQTPGTASVGPALAPAASAEYGLAAGDAVRISVYQSPDLTLEARISETGLVSYPLLGNVKIGGLSVGAAEKLIGDGLKNGNFLKSPQVSVLVTQVRGNQASVLGQVNRPGRFPLEATDLRLSDLLAIAGGIAVGGADTVILVGTRGGQRIRKEIDLSSIFRSATRENDMLVLNGDVVYVERAPIAYIYGEVQRPGPMRLERGLTVMQALATGGGLTQRGTERGLRLHRKGPDGKLQVLEPTMDDVLQDGDVVYVRESLF